MIKNKMENNKLLKKIYAFLDDAKTRAYIQYAKDKDARKVVQDIFFEIDNFFLGLEEEIEVEELSNGGII